jgi:hypothetical protein
LGDLGSQLTESNKRQEDLEKSIAQLNELSTLALKLAEALKREGEGHKSFTYIGRFLEKSIKQVQQELDLVDTAERKIVGELKIISTERTNLDKLQRLHKKEQEKVMMMALLEGLDLPDETETRPKIQEREHRMTAFFEKLKATSDDEKGDPRKTRHSIEAPEKRRGRSKSRERPLSLRESTRTRSKSREKAQPSDDIKSTGNDGLRNSRLLPKGLVRDTSKPEAAFPAESSGLRPSGSEVMLILPPRDECEKSFSFVVEGGAVASPSPESLAPQCPIGSTKLDDPSNPRSEKAMSELLSQLQNVKQETIEIEKQFLHAHEQFKFLLKKRETLEVDSGVGTRYPVTSSDIDQIKRRVQTFLHPKESPTDSETVAPSEEEAGGLSEEYEHLLPTKAQVSSAGGSRGGGGAGIATQQQFPPSPSFATPHNLHPVREGLLQPLQPKSTAARPPLSASSPARTQMANAGAFVASPRDDGFQKKVCIALILLIFFRTISGDVFDCKFKTSLIPLYPSLPLHMNQSHPNFSHPLFPPFFPHSHIRIQSAPETKSPALVGQTQAPLT